jgi:hypothetical protein
MKYKIGDIVKSKSVDRYKNAIIEIEEEVVFAHQEWGYYELLNSSGNIRMIDSVNFEFSSELSLQTMRDDKLKALLV